MKTVKYYFLTSLIAVLASFLCLGGAVSADEAGISLPEPGITPDSPFYFMDGFGKHIALMFTFNAENRVCRALRYAEERLSEVEAMAAQYNYRAMERAANEYQKFLGIATRNMEKAMLKGTEVSEETAAMMAQHIAHTYRFMQQNQVAQSEEGQQVTEQIRERAAVTQQNALQTMAVQDPEGAIKLNLSLMQQECNNLQNMLGEDNDSQVEDCLAQYERLREMNQQMIRNAEQAGMEPETQQAVQEAVANQEQVIAQIRNQAQNSEEEAGGASEDLGQGEQTGSGNGSTQSGPAGKR